MLSQQSNNDCDPVPEAVDPLVDSGILSFEEFHEAMMAKDKALGMDWKSIFKPREFPSFNLTDRPAFQLLPEVRIESKDVVPETRSVEELLAIPVVDNVPDPVLDMDKLQDPHQFFTTLERHINAKKTLCKIRGEEFDPLWVPKMKSSAPHPELNKDWSPPRNSVGNLKRRRTEFHLLPTEPDFVPETRPLKELLALPVLSLDGTISGGTVTAIDPCLTEKNNEKDSDSERLELLKEHIEIQRKAIMDFKLPDIEIPDVRSFVQSVRESMYSREDQIVDETDCDDEALSIARRRYKEAEAELLKSCRFRQCISVEYGGSPTPPRNPSISFLLPPQIPSLSHSFDLGISSHGENDVAALGDICVLQNREVVDEEDDDDLEHENQPEIPVNNETPIADLEHGNEPEIPVNNEAPIADLEPGNEPGIPVNNETPIADLEHGKELEIPANNEGGAEVSIKPTKPKRVYKKKQKKSNDELKRLSLVGSGTSVVEGLRRSSRIRSRPLEYWKGERFLYGRIHESLVTVIGVKKYDTPDTAKTGKRRSLKVKSFVSDEFQDLVDLAALD